MTLEVPNLSANAPAMGWDNPHSRFWSARENAKTSRPYPNVSDTGFKKRPSEDLKPKFIAKRTLANTIAKLIIFLCCDILILLT